MSNSRAFLEEIRIKNFRSLREVTLPLKPLTILVGPNASGKSNVLEALRLLNRVMIAEEPPPSLYVQDQLWAGKAGQITFEALACIEETAAAYKLVLKADAVDP